MDLRLADLMTLARDTVLTPREGVARLLGLNLPLEARWLCGRWVREMTNATPEQLGPLELAVAYAVLAR
ncbi:hypothetical protein EOM89_09875, partial [Candidatus Falkowbacteria bacterium]|nr:hypothetical protein [Candidatus Falkowbacteria bacterium]